MRAMPPTSWGLPNFPPFGQCAAPSGGIVPQRNASLWSKLLIHENLTKRDFAIRLGRHHSSQCRPLALSRRGWSNWRCRFLGVNGLTADFAETTRMTRSVRSFAKIWWHCSLSASYRLAPEDIEMLSVGLFSFKVASGEASQGSARHAGEW